MLFSNILTAKRYIKKCYVIFCSEKLTLRSVKLKLIILRVAAVITIKVKIATQKIIRVRIKEPALVKTLIIKIFFSEKESSEKI